MKTILAGRDDRKGVSEVLIDEQDTDVAGPWKWRVTHNGYVYRNSWGAVQVKIYLHRAIMRVTHASREVEVDHINHDKLDNRRENLRLCTRSLNNAARLGNRKRKYSDYRGVTYAKSKKTKPWKAQIGYRGKNVNIGRYKTEEEAAKSYDKEARRLFGEFARPNFPDEP